jgi:hypothetical protein
MRRMQCALITRTFVGRLVKREGDIVDLTAIAFKCLAALSGHCILELDSLI